MGRLWYFTIRSVVRVGLYFYFRKILVVGRTQIPKQGPVLFVVNHQNAFLDALILATVQKRYTHYLARADVFKSSFISWWLNTLNIMPIYRFRDGRTSLGMNTAIFQRCHQILAQGETLLIFPEGNHGQQRRLRPLSKGFTRIVFGTLEWDPELSISIVPVGLNYSNHQISGSAVSVYFGPALEANSYFDPADPQGSAQRLRIKVAAEMKELITHVEDNENYDHIIARLDNAEPNYLDPAATNQSIKTLTGNEGTIDLRSERKMPLANLLGKLIQINCLIPLGCWRLIKNKIKDPVFIASIKFCLGLVLVPLSFLLQSYLVYLIAGGWVAVIYSVFCLVTLRLRNLLMESDN